MRSNRTSKNLLAALSLLLVFLPLTSGCAGSSSTQSAAAPSSAPTSPTSSAASAGSGSQPAGALAADAKSAATGDIPDTQNFLTLRSPSLHVSMLYPEGWTVKEAGSVVSITDKNNRVQISVASAPVPTTASVMAALSTLKQAVPSLTAGTPQTLALKGGPVVKVSYTTRSAPNPVTGKQVTLTVDRYVVAHAGKVATVDLGTPVGVDNVDAYKKMIASLTWQ